MTGGYYDLDGEWNAGSDNTFPCANRCDNRMELPGETCSECMAFEASNEGMRELGYFTRVGVELGAM